MKSILFALCLMVATPALADLLVSPFSLSFVTSPGGSDSRFVTIWNRGEEAVTGLRVDRPIHWEFDTWETCPSTLEPGRSCSVSVTFRPRTAGDFIHSTLMIRADGEFKTVSLSGRTF